MTDILKRLFLLVLAAGLILSFLIVFGVSVNADSNISFPPSALFARWYTVLLTECDWLIPIRNSLVIAAFALGLGPFMLPPIIIAMGASAFWAEMGWYGWAEAIVISHGVPFVTSALVIFAPGT